MVQLNRVMDSALGRVMPYFRQREFKLGVLTFFISLLCARVSLLGFAPFGLAVLCAIWIARLNQYYALFGCALGSLLLGGMNPLALLPYALFMMCCLVIRAYRKRLLKRDMLLCLIAAKLLSLPFAVTSMLSIALGAADTLLCLAMAIVLSWGIGLLRQQKRTLLSQEETISVCILAGVAIMGMDGLSIFDFSFNVIVSALLALLMAYWGGAVTGAAAGVALGLTLCASGRDIMIMGSMGVCALLGGTFKKLGRLGVVAGFIAGSAILQLFLSGGDSGIPLGDILAASLFMMLLPKGFVASGQRLFDFSVLRSRRDREAMQKIKELTTNRLKDVADVLDELGALLRPEDDTDEGNVFGAVAAQLKDCVCIRCSHRRHCWKDEPAACDALERMVHEHLVLPCPPLYQRCEHSDIIINITRSLLLENNARRSAEQRLLLSKDIATAQLKGAGLAVKLLAEGVEEVRFDPVMEFAVLEWLDREGITGRGAVALKTPFLHISVTLERKFSAEKVKHCICKAAKRPMRLIGMNPQAGGWRLEFEEAHNFDLQLGIAEAPLDGNDVSGDACKVMELGGGKVLAALSDGMGSGETAARESGATIAIIGKLLSAGFEKDVALRSINKLLMLRGEESFATLDLCLIDLIAGQAEFIKLGAMPSFLVRSGRVATIAGGSLPAGILDEAVPQVRSVPLEDGDSIVLMSDGIHDTLDFDTPAEVIRCCMLGDPDTAAQALVEVAKNHGARDDMSTVMLKIVGNSKQRRKAV